MLDQALTTNHCRNIVKLLIKRRRWSIARIARTIGKPVEYVQRIQTGKQSFQVADVDAIARACKSSPAMLLFDSMNRQEIAPSMKGLYDLTNQEVDRHHEFQRALARKPTKKRRPRTKAA